MKFYIQFYKTSWTIYYSIDNGSMKMDSSNFSSTMSDELSKARVEQALKDYLRRISA